MSVNIFAVSPKTYSYLDFQFFINLSHPIDLNKARNDLKNYPSTRFTRLLPAGLTYPTDRVWVSPTNYVSSYVFIVSHNSIDFRGILPFGLSDTEKQNTIQLYATEGLKPFVTEGLITPVEYQQILDFFKPLANILKIAVSVGAYDFNYYLESDWKRRVHFDFPSSWVGRAGVPQGDWDYAVKYKCMLLWSVLQGMDVYVTFGRKSSTYSDTELQKRSGAGMRPLIRNRKWIYDPDNKVMVSMSVKKGRRVGYCDFSAFPSMPLLLNLTFLNSVMSANYATKYVSRVGD